MAAHSNPSETLANDARTSTELDAVIENARLLAPSEQTRLVMGVADLYASKNNDNTKAFAAFFTDLVKAAAYDVRQGLSRRLGSADWLPIELVRTLANDDIQIARPVISASPLLTDEDLLQLLAEASTDHRLQVALRPGLGEAVSTAILESEEPLLLTALGSNIYAHLPEGGVEALVEASARISGLRQPMSRHPGLNEVLAERLYRWVGDTMRDELCRRFPHHCERLKQAVNDTVDHINDAHIAAKMEASGRLTPSALIRILKDGRQTLFMHSLSILANIRVSDLEILLSKPSARPFYLACLAAGVDRPAFPELLEALRALDPSTPPALLESELRLAERARHQAQLEVRAYIDSLQIQPRFQ